MSFELCTGCASCLCSPLLTWNVATKMSSSSCSGKVFTYAAINEWIFDHGNCAWCPGQRIARVTLANSCMYAWELLTSSRCLGCSSRSKAAACCTRSASSQIHAMPLLWPVWQIDGPWEQVVCFSGEILVLSCKLVTWRERNSLS